MATVVFAIRDALGDALVRPGHVVVRLVFGKDGATQSSIRAAQPQAPAELRRALRTIDQHIDDYITRARLGRAA